MSRDGALVVQVVSAEARDRALLEGISDAVVAIDQAGTVTYWGPGAAALYGVAPADAVGRPLERLYTYRWDSPDDERRAWAALEHEGRWRGRNVHVLPSGDERHVESTVTVLHDEAGRRSGLIAVIRDETARVEAERARRAAEEALRESEQRARARAAELETVLDTVPAAVWISRDPRGDRIDANRLGAEMLRQRPGANVSVTAPGAERPRDFTVRRRGETLSDDELPMQQAARRGVEIRGAEIDIVFADGEVRHLLGNAAPLPDGAAGTKGSVGAFIDITDRKRAEQALRELIEELDVARDKLAKVIGALPVGIGISDTRGTTLSMNDAALRLHGFRSQEEMHAELPRYLERFELRRLDGTALPFDEWPVAKAMRGEFVSGYELVLRNREAGTERVASYSALPIRNGAGDVVLFAYVMQDVTDAKKSQHLVERHNEQLREADRLKDAFLALLSHELRNPLAPIRNSLVLLDRAPADGPVARRAMEVLRRQTEQLSRVVDDLLDISRITHGKIEVQLARMDAREVVRRCYADAKGLFDQREVDLLLSEPREPLWVDADAARFAQMLGNLLHNALKFTPPRGLVQVRVARRGAACEVSVRDTGLGIEPSEVNRIFDPFVQADRTRRGQSGLGLGLALVRELATKHGGSVRAESAGPGTGAEFVIQLPLADAPESGGAPHARAGRGPGLSVLVVEDNEDAGATLADLLAIGGHEVRVATTGAAAIEAASSHPPQVLLCDVGLPDMSGHDVIRALRAMPAGRRLFAVALTGYAQPQDRDAALAAGFDAHLPKPPALEELEAMLEEAAEAAARPREA